MNFLKRKMFNLGKNAGKIPELKIAKYFVMFLGLIHQLIAKCGEIFTSNLKFNLLLGTGQPWQQSAALFAPFSHCQQ
jgi:hypothetical protein